MSHTLIPPIHNKVRSEKTGALYIYIEENGEKIIYNQKYYRYCSVISHEFYPITSGR